MKKAKRLLPLFLSVVLLLGTVTLFSVSSFAASTVKSGGFEYKVGKTSASVVNYTGSGGSVKVPAKIKNVPVTSIGDYAFWQQKSVTSVTLPSSLKKIGIAAFNECSGIKKIVIPEGTTSIGDAAFWFCTSLKTVLLPKSLKSVGENAFKGCAAGLTAYVYKSTFAETYVKSNDAVALGYRQIATLSAADVTVAVGESASISYKYTPSKVYTSAVAYDISDTSVAKVSSSGKITALACGVATVKLTAKDSGKAAATLTVRVVPKKVTVTQSAKTCFDLTLTWTKSAGATRYTVQSYDKTKKAWINEKTTTATTYKKTGLDQGYSASFRVVAEAVVGANTLKSTSASVKAGTRTLAKVKGLALSGYTSTSDSLKWKAVTGADGYGVYSYNKTKKTYSLLGTTKALAYTVKDLKANKEYSYAVRAYAVNGAKKEVYSPYYSAVIGAATAPKAPTKLTCAENLTRSVTLRWNGVASVTGYQIAYSSDDKSGTVSLAASSAEKTLTTLTGGKVFTLKVRSYTTYSGKKYYSDYSAAIKVTTKPYPTSSQDAVTKIVDAFAATTAAQEMKIYAITKVSSSGVGDSVSSKVVAELKKQLPFADGLYSITGGRDASTKKTPSKILVPKGKLTAAALDASSVKYYPDGNGFSAVGRLAGATPSPFAAGYDVAAVEKACGVTIADAEYTTSFSGLKIQNGLLDSARITVTFSGVAQDGAGSHNFSVTQEVLYAFAY